MESEEAKKQLREIKLRIGLILSFSFDFQDLFIYFILYLYFL